MQPEVRIIVETRAPTGGWTQTAIVPLNDEQRATVSEWLFDIWFNFSPEYEPSEAPEVAPAEFGQEDQPAFTEAAASPAWPGCRPRTPRPAPQ